MIDPIFQVSELVEAVNQHLNLLGEITIEGEISRIDIKSGRLIFITIKDSQSAVDVFGLTHIIRNVHQLEMGMVVHVHGTAGLYKGSGRFRVQAAQISPHGEGSLKTAFELLKTKLESEGIFEESHKRKLPDWPVTIGLITATNSSAYHDVVKILGSRMGGIQIRHLPVNVQGREAMPTMMRAMKYVNFYDKKFDLVILTRGGGSLEDLQAFNSEELTRAVFGCKVPVISAVGHEDDWSLTDYAADVRASTPSNAAELAVRDKREVELMIETLHGYTGTKLRQQRADYYQNIDIHLRTIGTVLNKAADRVSSRVKLMEDYRKIYLQEIMNRREKIGQRRKLILSEIHNSHKLHGDKTRQLERLIRSLDYTKVLERGYSITKSGDGRIITSKEDVQNEDVIETVLADGKIESVVERVIN